jgi:hypothetical protein
MPTNSNSPAKSVRIRPLCAQRMAANGMLGDSASEKFEAILAVDMEGIETEEEEGNCCKFVISWRRKATMEIDGEGEEMAKKVEPKWIVASVRTFNNGKSDFLPENKCSYCKSSADLLDF